MSLTSHSMRNALILSLESSSGFHEPSERYSQLNSERTRVGSINKGANVITSIRCNDYAKRKARPVWLRPKPLGVI